MDSWGAGLSANSSVSIQMGCIWCQGVWLKNKWHRGSNFFNFKGVFLRHLQIKLRRSYTHVFTVIKELKGLLWWVSHRNKPSILWYSYVLCCWRVMISTFQREYVWITAVDGALAFMTKSVGRASKIFPWLAWGLISKSYAPAIWWLLLTYM